MLYQLTCLTCRVVFPDTESQREHHKSDWHRYNLKCKTAKLPQVTKEEFQRIVQFHVEKRTDKLQDKCFSCLSCGKSFSSQNTYSNHLKSRKHNELLNKLTNSPGKPTGSQQKSNILNIKPKPTYTLPPEGYNSDGENSDEWEDMDDEDNEDLIEDSDGDDQISDGLPPNFCLFCPHQSVNMENNFLHMSKSHSFFIPDVKYVIDLEGYFVYLGAKVGEGKVCLRCNNHSRQFSSVRACQTHMVDKGHCTLDYEGDAMLEYSDFYDFSQSYPDHSDVDIDVEFPVNTNSIGVDEHTMELLLPSGSRAGHRALRRYYKQSIHPAEHVKARNTGLITGLTNQYKSLGLTDGASLNLAVRRTLHATKIENTRRNNNCMRLGVKANKLMKHFRLQNEGGG